MTPYGDRPGSTLAQVMAWCWRHQAITWTIVDWSSVKSSDIQIRAISQETPQPSITKIRLKITYLKFNSNLPGANELTIKPDRHVTHVYFTSWKRSLNYCPLARASSMDSPNKGKVMQTFDFSLNDSLNNLSKCPWFKTPWRLCDITVMSKV